MGPPLPQPIPISEIVAYLDALWLTDDPEDREDAVFLIQRLDSVFMADELARIARALDA